MHYDVVLIHPPSLYDFRKTLWFPGPVARTVDIYTPIFLMFPIGLVSIGSYLQDRGINVKIINLAEKMLVDKHFDAEHFLQGLKSDIYAIDLHWVVHSQGAVKVAELCKRLHPDSIVLLGGLTATNFADELVSTFRFIDCVVRGEGEEPLYRLIKNLRKGLDKLDAFSRTPNLTFLNRDRKVVRTENLNVVNTLDSLDFTRLELVEPHSRTLTSPLTGAKLWNLPIARGCLFNCASCGGSRYSYRKLMNRDWPALRSPKKLLEDFMILDEQRVRSIFLFQDARIGGKKYVEELLRTFKEVKWSHIKNVGLELFYPADRSYLEKLSENKIAENVGLSISPDSGVESVRRVQGRIYTNEQLLRTARHCRELNIPLGVFFMVGLGHETVETMRQTWGLWEKILRIHREVKGYSRIYVDFEPMIFLDPGSLAFDNPERYGYKLIFKTFRDYYQAMSLPHWKYWISYETLYMNRSDLARIALDSSEKLLSIKRDLGFITSKEFSQEKLQIDLDRIFISEFDKIMKLKDPEERRERIKELAEISKDPILSWSYVLTHSE